MEEPMALSVELEHERGTLEQFFQNNRHYENSFEIMYNMTLDPKNFEVAWEELEPPNPELGEDNKWKDDPHGERRYRRDLFEHNNDAPSSVYPLPFFD